MGKVQTSKTKPEIRDRVIELVKTWPSIGTGCITAMLKDEGFVISAYSVYRILAENKLLKGQR